jgi:hypothetical protein
VEDRYEKVAHRADFLDIADEAVKKKQITPGQLLHDSLSTRGCESVSIFAQTSGILIC